MSTDRAAGHCAPEDGHGLFGEDCAACQPEAAAPDGEPRTGADPLLSGPQASQKD